ncbi:hypothetical protein FRC12_012540 [Ceratobasidium sp. 428]|nr:hypothetical protein FRC12_012540 [Ceratobasidium sp. 428]
MQHLAITFAKEERWDKSVTLQREVVDACVVVFGPKHHNTRESLAILAKLRRNMSKSPDYRPRPEPSNYWWLNPKLSGHQWFHSDSEDGGDSSEDNDSFSLALANSEKSQDIPLPIPDSVEIGDGLLGGTDSPSLAPTDSETSQTIHSYIRNKTLGPETLSKGDSREPLKVQQKLSELSINSPGEPLWKAIPLVDAVPSTTPPRSPHYQDQNETSSKALNDVSQTASDRAITAVSTSDEDDWTTSHSFKGRPL